MVSVVSVRHCAYGGPGPTQPPPTWDLTVQSPPPPLDMFRLVRLDLTVQGHWPCPLPLTLVRYEALTVGKRAVCILLERLLVFM